MRSLGRAAALALALIGGTWLAAPTDAACGVNAEVVAKADIAFVGLLTSSGPEGTTGTFEVQDVWRGGLSIGDSVTIGGPLGIFSGPPERYLVLAQISNGTLRTGDSCDAYLFTWDESMAAFRPAGAVAASADPSAASEAPSADPSAASEAPADGSFPPVALLGAMFIGLVLVSLLVFGRRPRS